MKSCDDLAEEYAGRENGYATNLGFTMCKDAFIVGFDAGFARAVEMLKGDDAIEIDYFHKPVGLAPEEWANWLEKKSSTPTAVRKCGLCTDAKPCNFENCPDDEADSTKE